MILIETMKGGGSVRFRQLELWFQCAGELGHVGVFDTL